MSFALALLIHLLLLLLLLRLAPPISGPPPKGGPTVLFDVPTPAPAQTAAHKTSQRKQVQHTTHAAAKAVAPPPIRPPRTTDTKAQPWVLNPEIAGFSLQQGAPHPSEQVADSGDAGASGGSGGGAGKGVGTGSHGQVLYNAEWVREPTDAELNPYMPHGNFVGGWADIACRTIPRFHVEDCEELGQSPPGSGLSRALREAAFQFLVRPPRINGKAQVGEWVRIHFDFIEKRKE